jgi:succinate dehydrogenase (ubiquinone) membrane anchor subunit
VAVPEPDPKHGSYHWSFERLLAIGLVPLTVAPFAAGSLYPVADAALGAAVVLHSHIGFQLSSSLSIRNAIDELLANVIGNNRACISDYIQRKKYPRASKSARWMLNGATALVLYGLYEFETNDVGIAEGARRIWKA